MRLESSDRLSLDGSDLRITRGDLSGSVPIDPSFIKERLGFFESIINKICSFFSTNFWEKKEVTVLDHTETRYILASKIDDSVLSRLPTKVIASTSNTHSNFRQGTVTNKAINAATPLLSNDSAGAELEPLLAERPVTPTSRSASPVSAVETFRPSRSQMSKIISANRLCNWIGELRKAECKVKVSGYDLSIEPTNGVNHDLIEESKSTGTQNLLRCTFKTLESISPAKWTATDSNNLISVNFDKYIDACNDAISKLKSKSPQTKDDEIDLGLINAASILAKGLQQIKSGVKKTEKTFTGSGFNLNILAEYVSKYDKFGTKID